MTTLFAPFWKVSLSFFFFFSAREAADRKEETGGESAGNSESLPVRFGPWPNVT